MKSVSNPDKYENKNSDHFGYLRFDVNITNSPGFNYINK